MCTCTGGNKSKSKSAEFLSASWVPSRPLPSQGSGRRNLSRSGSTISYIHRVLQQSLEPRPAISQRPLIALSHPPRRDANKLWLFLTALVNLPVRSGRSEGRRRECLGRERSAGRFVGDRRYATVTSDPLSGGELGLGSNLGVSDLVQCYYFFVFTSLIHFKRGRYHCVYIFLGLGVLTLLSELIKHSRKKKTIGKERKNEGKMKKVDGGKEKGFKSRALA